MTVYYHSPDLPWNLSTRDEHRFRIILTVALITFLVVTVVIPYIRVPKLTREQVEVVPVRLAKIVIERKQPPPPVVLPKPVKQPETKVEQPQPVKPVPKAELKIEPKPEKKVAPVLEVKREPEPVQPPPAPKVDIEAARKKAASTGLLALSNDLAALRDKTIAPTAQADEKLIRPTNNEPLTVSRAMITSGVARPNSGGLPTANVSRNISGTQLTERTTTRVNSPAPAEVSSPKSAATASHKAGRTDEEIQLAFDKNKAALYSLYNRALRQDPTLQGKVVLKITIDPSGKVSACDVVSSELDSPELIQKIFARVLLFDFGSKDVPTKTTTYPVTFLPQS